MTPEEEFIRRLTCRVASVTELLRATRMSCGEDLVDYHNAADSYYHVMEDVIVDGTLLTRGTEFRFTGDLDYVLRRDDRDYDY